MKRDVLGPGANDPGVVGAQHFERRQPLIVPRRRAALLPEIEILVYPQAGALREGAE
jgi:hypothetical protein